MRGEFAPVEHAHRQHHRDDQRHRTQQPAERRQREIDRAHRPVEAARGGDAELGRLFGARIGERLVGLVGYRRHQHRAIPEEPVRPDELEEGIGEKQQHHQHPDLPDHGRGVVQRQVRGEPGQLLGIADQRQPAADGDHRRRGEEGGALAQVADQLGVEDARLAGHHLAHPVAAEALHQHRDRGAVGRGVLDLPADPDPGQHQEGQRGIIQRREQRDAIDPGHGCGHGPDSRGGRARLP